VRSFIEAYLRGSIAIAFPEDERKRKFPWSKKDEFVEKKLVKKSFRVDLSIASGAKESTYVELERAINHLFTFIVALRQGRRIAGDFSEISGFEETIKSLEARVRTLEVFMEEFRIHYKMSDGGRNSKRLP